MPATSSACSTRVCSPSAILCAPRARNSISTPSPPLPRSTSPGCAPEDTLKRKQFIKGAEQIAQEGAIQIFKIPYAGMEEVIVGVVGTLQFDVFQYRLKNEYNVDIIMETLPYEYLRWIESYDGDPEDIIKGNDVKLVEDYKGNKLLLFGAQWSINWVMDKNKGLVLSEFGGAKF